MVEVAADTARFDSAFNGTAWANQGLLLEKAATNLVGNSDYAQNPVPWALSSGTGFTVTRKTNGTLLIEPIDSTSRSAFQNPSAYRILNQSIDRYVAAVYVNSNDVFNYNYFTTSGGTGSGFMGDFNITPITDKSKNALETRAYKSIMRTSTLTNGDLLLGRNAAGAWLNIGYPQVELGSYPTSWIRTSTAAVTRAQDNLQLNLSNYTGSIKLTYKRQDNDATESAWIDLTNATNPILTNSVAVGIWLQNIAVYNRTLTAQEKANA